MSEQKKNDERNRTIQWDVDIDALAERLAIERGYNRRNGGVSQFLSDLISREAGLKKATGVETQLAEIRKEIASVKEKVAEYGKKKK